MLLLFNAGKLAANSEGAETLHDMCKRYVVSHVVDYFSIMYLVPVTRTQGLDTPPYFIFFHIVLPKYNAWHFVFHALPS